MLFQFLLSDTVPQFVSMNAWHALVLYCNAKYYTSTCVLTDTLLRLAIMLFHSTEDYYWMSVRYIISWQTLTKTDVVGYCTNSHTFLLKHNST